MRFFAHTFSAFFIIGVVLGCTEKPKAVADTPNEQKEEIIPFKVSEAHNIIFECILNGEDTIDLFFDTGATELVMRHEAIRGSHLLDGKNEMYSGQDYDVLQELNSLSIGNMVWDSLAIYPVGVGPLEAAGHFGWDLFDGKIVKLDYDKMEMTVLQNLKADTSEYVKLPLEFTHTLFCIETSLEVNGLSYPSRYLFDTGFQRAVILDRDLRVEDGFPDDLAVIKESRLRNSAGKEFINKVVSVDKVCFGAICANNVPIQLFSTPNPAQFKTHILGNELLKRFNTIFDFKEGYVYLKPNSLMDSPYMDAL